MNHVFKNLSREHSLSIISSLMLNDVYHEETILFLKAIYFIFKHKEKESDIRRHNQTILFTSLIVRL